MLECQMHFVPSAVAALAWAFGDFNLLAVTYYSVLYFVL